MSLGLYVSSFYFFRSGKNSCYLGLNVYLPESFEWLILRSGLLEDSEISKILESPEKYVDSLHYFSWERFFTDLLMQRTSNSYLSYTKSKLNPVYLQEQEKTAILSVIPKIQFKNEKDR